MHPVSQESNNNDTEFYEITRSCMLRFLSLSATSNNIQMHDELDGLFTRLLHNSSEIKEHIVNQLCNIQLKTDNHYLILITYLQNLVLQYSEQSDYHVSDNDMQNSNVVETDPNSALIQCIYSQAIKLIKLQKIHYSLNAKRCELITAMLQMPLCLNNIGYYSQLYNQLETARQFYPASIKQSQKKTFMKSIQQNIKIAGKYNFVLILEFLYRKILGQIIAQAQPLSQVILLKLKLIKTIIISVKDYHEEILNGSAYLLIKFSKNLTDNYGLTTIILNIYNQLLSKLIIKQSIVPLCLYQHIVINNLIILQKKQGKMLLKQILLSQISRIFQTKYLKYFLRLYDWNFMEQDVCLNSLKILYEYTQDHSNQKNNDYQLYKKHLGSINKSIQKFVAEFLSPAQNISGDNSFKKQRRQFYELKKKQYKQIIAKINTKPKDIFKVLTSIQNAEAKDDYIHKVLRILRKSKEIQPKSMINILSAGTPNSDLMMDKYLQTFLSACKGKTLEQFIRLFTSNFFLWGQAQQIQRVIDKLTVFYCKNQQAEDLIFKHTDVSYTFANAIIILNTDLHNPKHQNKMTFESFVKMCQKINVDQDLPNAMLREIFDNIKNDEIKTFRNYSSMHPISYNNWMFIALDMKSVSISYYDDDMLELSETQFYSYAYELLTNLIDEKQTAKLQLLVERFDYSDKKFDCQIIQKIRQMITNKPHIAMHILQKVYEEARFQTRNIDDKLISYYWLATNIVENFYQYIPYSKICQFLLVTWRIGYELKDALKMRENAEFKSFRKMLKQFKKRQSKKSIMDMFSKFLATKDSDDEEQKQQNSPHFLLKKKLNFTNYSVNVLQILAKSADSKTRAAQAILISLRNQQTKRYEQFLSCLYLFFYLLKDCDSEQSKDVLLTFYQSLLNIEQCKLGERINNLKTKSEQKYELLYSYCLFWSFKLLVKLQQTSYELQNSKNFQRVQRVLKHSVEFMKKCNKITIEEYLAAFKLPIDNQEKRKQLKILGIYDQLSKSVKLFNIDCSYIEVAIEKPEQAKVQSKIEKKTSFKTEPIIQSKTDSKAETKNEVKTEPKIQNKAETKIDSQLQKKEEENKITEKSDQLQLPIEQDLEKMLQNEAKQNISLFKGTSEQPLKQGNKQIQTSQQQGQNNQPQIKNNNCNDKPKSSYKKQTEVSSTTNSVLQNKQQKNESKF